MTFFALFSIFPLHIFDFLFTNTIFSFEKGTFSGFFEKIYTIGTLLAYKKMDIIAKDF